MLSPILSLKEENFTLKTPLISVPNPNEYHIFPDWLEEKCLVLQIILNKMAFHHLHWIIRRWIFDNL